MPRIGKHDAFELAYMAKLRALLARHGVPLEYAMDRAAIDTGLHLFAEGPTGLDTSQVRVWFQAKGTHASTFSADNFHARGTIAEQVQVNHLRFWYAAPEPVYLVVCVESVDLFIAEDVRDIVDRQWPRGSFYRDVPESQHEITLYLATECVLDDERVAAMLRHRSMRIDGPSFRGRPLGHRFDPLRSQISAPPSDLFLQIVRRLLQVHDFRPDEAARLAPDITVLRGRLYQTLEWQSPAFAEYGFGPSDDFRVEPKVESIHGRLTLVVDSAVSRTQLPDQLRAAVIEAIRQADGRDKSTTAAIIFNAPDLSGTGGLWRSAVRGMPDAHRPTTVRQLGLEAVSSLLLTATLVYLDFAPQIAWNHVNYLY